MNVTVYVPKDLEAALKKRARQARLSPALLIQSMLRTGLSSESARFSSSFEALAGSWEDERSADEIVRDITDRRRNARRGALR